MYEPFRKGMPLNLGGILFSGTPQTPSLNIPGSIPSGRTYSGFLFQDEEGHTPLLLCAYRGKNTPESPRNSTEKGTVLLSVSMAAGPCAFENAA